MSEPPAQALMLGLPSSGKTSFLAAFYHVVESAKVQGALKLVRYPPVREYLEQIRGDWVSLVRQTRTQSATVDQNLLELSSTTTGKTFNMFFPDVAGESCRALVEDRTCQHDLAELIEATDRILLFIHPDKVIDSPTIADVNSLMSALQEEDSNAELPKAAENAPQDGDQIIGEAAVKVESIPWNAEMISTQVKLVGLVQATAEICSGLKRICVIVSAWDRVQAQSITPEVWLEARLPFLWQYLGANRERTEYRIFGVSAVGGDLEEDRKALEVQSPADRIHVVGNELIGSCKDITAPVQWLLR